MIGIISDIHGNYPALMAVLEKLDNYKCEKIYSLGDICGYYCMVNECIEELKKRNIVNIMGNHDDYILNNKRCERSTTVNFCLDYQRMVLKKENYLWLKNSVPYIKENGYWMVHGGWNDYLDEYISDYSFLNWNDRNIKIYISGHTHIQKRIEMNGKIYFNPGAVGQPRDYKSTASYAVIDDNGQIILNRTEYDIDQIVKEMKKAGFDDRVTSCLYQGCKIGERIIL